MVPSRVVRPLAAVPRTICAVAIALGVLGVGCGPSTPANVLLITLDTTRADHLGVYGYRKDTSPNIDSLASRATLYRNAHSTSSWTLPAHASIFTGKLPSSHGARYDPKGPLVLGEAIDGTGNIRARGVSPQEDTLAARLSRAGYVTAGFAGGPWLLRTFGLSNGFDHWDDAGITDFRGRRADDLFRAVTAWLDHWRADPARKPFFVFANFFDAHFPYEPPAEYALRFLPPGVELDYTNRSQWEALYDGEICYVDAYVGRLLDYLRRHGLYDDTLVIVTADHGEMFGEHGEWGHNGLLFEPLVRVPLVVKPPGPPHPRVDDEPIQLDGLFDLVLSAAGLARSPSDGPRTRAVLAEVWHPSSPGVGTWKVLWEGSLKYMHSGEGAHRLYDLAADPNERVNRIADRPDDARRMELDLDQVLASLPPPLPAGKPQEIDAKTRQMLGRLGYLDGR